MSWNCCHVKIRSALRLVTQYKRTRFLSVFNTFHMANSIQPFSFQPISRHKVSISLFLFPFFPSVPLTLRLSCRNFHFHPLRAHMYVHNLACAIWLPFHETTSQMIPLSAKGSIIHNSQWIQSEGVLRIIIIGRIFSIEIIPDSPPTSIFFKFLASRMTTVSFPAVGTYRREKQISPSLFSCN